MDIEEAKKQIKRVIEDVASDLDLSGLGLSTLPVELFELVKLKTLNLSNNLLPNLPAEIGNLANLEALDLSYNKLTSLPVEIYNKLKTTLIN